MRTAPPAKRSGTSFRLQFPRAQLRNWANRYQVGNEVEALQAGKRIRGGDCRPDNLRVIVKWKSHRRLSLLETNTDKEITEALRYATIAENERTAVAVLTGLNGVHVPVASAILTCIEPLRYTVIDFRALEALGVTDKGRTIDLYLDYLEFCRELAASSEIALRDLDHALWCWSDARQ